MAQRLTRKQMKQDQFVEAAFDLGEWLEEHWRPAAAVLVGVVVLALTFVGWSAWSRRTSDGAARLLSEGIRSLQGDETLKPDPLASLGLFEQAASTAPRSGAGQAADYYRGAALLALDRPADAVNALERAASRARQPVLAGAANALLAEAYLRAGRDEDAVAVWRRLIDGSAGAYPAPQARLGLAGALLSQGNAEEAIGTLERVTRDAPQSPASSEAFRLLQKLGAF
jgi:tetratricopeptide (TPR) repeat protein